MTSQRLAGVALSVFILLSTPLYSWTPFNDTTAIPTSPLEGMMLSLLHSSPGWRPHARWMLLPGAFYKQLASVGYGCVSGNVPCRPASLIDLPYLLDKSNTILSHVERYRTATAGYDTYLALGNTLLVVSGLSSVFVPVKMGILGMLILVFGLWMSEMTPLPTFVFFCMLIVFSAFSEKEAAAHEASNLKKAGGGSKAAEPVVTPKKSTHRTPQESPKPPSGSGKSKKHK